MSRELSKNTMGFIFNWIRSSIIWTLLARKKVTDSFSGMEEGTTKTFNASLILSTQDRLG